MRPMKDPAPSRLAYRMNRLMLTPAFRRFLRYGLPVLVVLAAVGLWASDPDRRTDAQERFAEIKRQVQERPEFMVNMMAVEDASEVVSDDIRGRLALDFPVSSFDLDLDAIRAEVERVAAVRSASVHVRAGGVLSIEVVERVPVVVWRTQEGLKLLDSEGVATAGIQTRSDRPDLPLVVGLGADQAVSEALDLFDIAQPAAPRLRGLLRVGERRWDVVLDRDQRILLPEEGATRALERVMALDAAQDLLARDIAVIDFRNPRRPVLRLTEGAIQAMYETSLTETGDVTQ